MKRSLKIAIAAILVLLLAAAMFFVLPVKKIDSNEVEYLSVTVSGERTVIEGEEYEQVTALLEETRARRMFAPAYRYDENGGMELSLVTDDGPLHIILGAGSSYMYSSSDDTIWYSIIDGEKLKNDIENALS
ncbi:MAG: hypothetical protein ACI3VE_00415 [Oscillospiraceae bacterium]